MYFWLLMRTLMHAIKKMESDGMFDVSEEIGSAHYLSKWSFIRIMTIDGEEIKIEKQDVDAPTNIILNHGYMILEYR